MTNGGAEMVKGVNKTVIEINDTGSNIFEKVILFVTPKYSNLSSKRLKTEATRVVNNFSDSNGLPTVRQMHKNKRILKYIILSVAVAVVGLVLFLIFK